VTVDAQVPVVMPGLLHAAPPLQSAALEQEHWPALHCDVAPLGPGQLASVVHAAPERRQVPVAVWHASPLQSALVAQRRPATGKLAEQSVADVVTVQPPFWQVPDMQSAFEPHCAPEMLFDA